MIKQKTIKYSLSLKGVGVHSGVGVSVCFRPAPSNTGVVFRRIDLKEPVDIPAKLENVINTKYSTTVGTQGVEVKTIEHLMSALYGLGIDNIFIDINNHEVPIMDGSANDFVFILKSAGLVEQSEDRRYLKINKKVSISNKHSSVSLEPYNGFKLLFSLDYDHAFFKEMNQEDAFDFACHSYESNVARARTFGFLNEAEYMRKNNLALGSSLDNTIVLNDIEVINAQGLRYKKELVKHKILDAIGDLYLGSYRVLGLFVGNKSGHTLNNQLMKKLIKDKKAWSLVTCKEEFEGNHSTHSLEESTESVLAKVAVS